MKALELPNSFWLSFIYRIVCVTFSVEILKILKLQLLVILKYCVHLVKKSTGLKWLAVRPAQFDLDFQLIF